MGCGASRRIEEALTIARAERASHIETLDRLEPIRWELDARAEEIKRLQDETLVFEEHMKQQTELKIERLTNNWQTKYDEQGKKLERAEKQTEEARDDAARSRSVMMTKDELQDENSDIRRELHRLRTELEQKHEEDKKREIVHQGQLRLMSVEHQQEIEKLNARNRQMRDQCFDRVARMQETVNQAEMEKQKARLEANRQAEVNMMYMKTSGLPLGTGGALSPMKAG